MVKLYTCPLAFFLCVLVGDSLGSSLPKIPKCGWDFSRNFHCPDYSDSQTSQWQRQVQCWRCPIGTEYQCARVIGDNEIYFKEGCAVPKNCTIGTEPRMDIYKGTITCENCHDEDKFNDDYLKLSTSFTECPLTKTICTSTYHLISCGRPDVSSGNRWCRCDARNNFVFYHGHPDEQGCSNTFTTKCVKYIPCPDGKARSTRGDYMTCLEDCQAGEYRRHDSDDCVKTTIIRVVANLSTENIGVYTTFKHDSATQGKDDATPGRDGSILSTVILILVFGSIVLFGIIAFLIAVFLVITLRPSL